MFRHNQVTSRKVGEKRSQCGRVRIVCTLEVGLGLEMNMDYLNKNRAE